MPPPPTRAELAQVLQRLDSARGHLLAALRIPRPTPEALARARRRAAGCVRRLLAEAEAERREGHADG